MLFPLGTISTNRRSRLGQAKFLEDIKDKIDDAALRHKLQRRYPYNEDDAPDDTCRRSPCLSRVPWAPRAFSPSPNRGVIVHRGLAAATGGAIGGGPKAATAGGYAAAAAVKKRARAGFVDRSGFANGRSTGGGGDGGGSGRV